MNMTRLKISKTLLAVTLGSVLVSGSALAESSAMDKAQSTADTAGQKIDSSMNKVGNFMDDSAITAKVKAALVDHEDIKSTALYLAGHLSCEIVQIIGRNCVLFKKKEKKSHYELP